MKRGGSGARVCNEAKAGVRGTSNSTVRVLISSIHRADDDGTWMQGVAPRRRYARDRGGEMI